MRNCEHCRANTERGYLCYPSRTAAVERVGPDLMADGPSGRMHQLEPFVCPFGNGWHLRIAQPSQAGGVA